ncbi:17845_t:CDS:2 [Funneliformis caledonium]|uniref:17845_t:CDS:1 n=1 Tax=Funneliformis caledonium TaxID=1117310 RepID=A0A9N9CXR7_9GLOM|nr:17845_t:CDS:2 [Funneliformis caledonium]
MFRINNFKNLHKFTLNIRKQNFISSSKLQKKLTLPPLKDEALRDEVLTHPSTPQNNHHSYKRYCFYGDKVYNYFIARELYNKLPNASNAELTIRTHQLISRSFLAKIATECGLDKSIKLAKNYPMSDGILSENVEAQFALYILNGMEDEMKMFIADVVDYYFENEVAQEGKIQAKRKNKSPITES